MIPPSFFRDNAFSGFRLRDTLFCALRACQGKSGICGVFFWIE